MTICIAATAADRSAVVVASDRMVSAGFLNLEFDHPGTKIEGLGPSCVGLTAGDALPVGDLFASAHSFATQLQNPQVGRIAETIKDEYCRLRAKRINEAVFRPRSVTIESFYQDGLIRQFPPEVAMQLDDRVQRMEFGVSVIVAGVDQHGAHIFGITDPGVAASYDRIGYHAIGSGLSHALLSLVGTGQHWSTPINETIFNVFRAKRQSEVAPGVGRSIDLRVIKDGGINVVSEEEVSKLDEVLRDLDVPHKGKVNKVIAELQFSLDEEQSR